MENDCVVTSFSSSALLAAKSCNENIRVGYILSAAYGDYYDMKNIDFFSVNAAFYQRELLMQFIIQVNKCMRGRLIIKILSRT